MNEAQLFELIAESRDGPSTWISPLHQNGDEFTANFDGELNITKLLAALDEHYDAECAESRREEGYVL